MEKSPKSHFPLLIYHWLTIGEPNLALYAGPRIDLPRLCPKLLNKDGIVSAARIWMIQICAGLAISATTTGCSSTGSVSRPIAPALIENERALALPPPGGPGIVGVIERKRGNGVEQTISLATASRVPGQNYLKIQFLGSRGSQGQSIPFKTISEGSIAREAAAAVPGVRLSPRTVFLQNSYGPFAYAAGRSVTGDICLYAWQQIRAGTASSGIGRNFGMIQVRWRLCDSHATEEQLLSAIYGYTITGMFEGAGWNPFGAPPSADRRLGRPGHTIYPLSSNLAPSGPPRGYAGGVNRHRTSAPTRPRTQVSKQVEPQRTRDEATKTPRIPAPDATLVPRAAKSLIPPVQQEVKVQSVTVPSPEEFLPPQP